MIFSRQNEIDQESDSEFDSKSNACFTDHVRLHYIYIQLPNLKNADSFLFSELLFSFNMVYLKKILSHTLGRQWWSTKRLKNEEDYHAGSAMTSASLDPTCLPLPGNSLTLAGAATLVASPDSSLIREKIFGCTGAKSGSRLDGSCRFTGSE